MAGDPTSVWTDGSALRGYLWMVFGSLCEVCDGCRDDAIATTNYRTTSYPNSWERAPRRPSVCVSSRWAVNVT